MKRGYFGIGIYGCKFESNVGMLWRSANCFGADFIFTVMDRYKHDCTDTMKTPKHVPLLHFIDWDDFFDHVPQGCHVVAVELSDMATMITEYEHHDRCVYLLGAEDNGLPEEIIKRCDDVVQIPGKCCLNVSTAGSIVMYDRIAKRHET